eukprot:252748-Pleurochrysis_carterae.AAC.3
MDRFELAGMTDGATIGGRARVCRRGSPRNVETDHASLSAHGVTSCKRRHDCVSKHHAAAGERLEVGVERLGTRAVHASRVRHVVHECDLRKARWPLLLGKTPRGCRRVEHVPQDADCLVILDCPPLDAHRVCRECAQVG